MPLPEILLQIVSVLVAVLLGLWLIDQIPNNADGSSATIKLIIRVIVIAAVVIWLLSILFGWLPASGAGFYPRYH